MTFVGIFLTSISVSIFKASLFGTDPFSCFAIGIWNLSQINSVFPIWLRMLSFYLGFLFLTSIILVLELFWIYFLPDMLLKKECSFLIFIFHREPWPYDFITDCRSCSDVFCIFPLFYCWHGGFSLRMPVHSLLQRKLNFHSEHAELELTFSSQHWDSSWEQLSVLEHLLQLLAWVL